MASGRYQGPSHSEPEPYSRNDSHARELHTILSGIYFTQRAIIDVLQSGNLKPAAYIREGTPDEMWGYILKKAYHRVELDLLLNAIESDPNAQRWHPRIRELRGPPPVVGAERDEAPEPPSDHEGELVRGELRGMPNRVPPLELHRLRRPPPARRAAGVLVITSFALVAVGCGSALYWHVGGSTPSTPQGRTALAVVAGVGHIVGPPSFTAHGDGSGQAATQQAPAGTSPETVFTATTVPTPIPTLSPQPARAALLPPSHGPKWGGARPPPAQTASDVEPPRVTVGDSDGYKEAATKR